MSQVNCKKPSEYVYDGLSTVGKTVGGPLKCGFNELTGHSIMKRAGMDVSEFYPNVGGLHGFAAVAITVVAGIVSLIAIGEVNQDIAQCARRGIGHYSCDGYSHFATQMAILKYATAALITINILPAAYRVGKFKKEQRVEAQNMRVNQERIKDHVERAKDRALQVGFGKKAIQHKGEDSLVYADRLNALTSSDRLGGKPKMAPVLKA
jgi:hypothetical protein